MSWFERPRSARRRRGRTPPRCARAGAARPPRPRARRSAVKLKREVQLVVRGRSSSRRARWTSRYTSPTVIRLAGVAVEQLPDLAQTLMGRAASSRWRAGRVIAARRPVVREGGVLADAVDHVDAEPVDAAVEPEAQRVVHGRPHLGVVPVQVGLLGQEEVQVPLAGPLVQVQAGPSPKAACQLLGGCRGPSRQTYQPRFGTVGGRARLDEPRVLVAGVVRDPVEEARLRPRAWARPAGGRSRRGAEQRVDVAVVGDVVAEVGHRRAEEGREPDGVDARASRDDRGRRDAGQVADAVAIGVSRSCGDRSGRRRRTATMARRGHCWLAAPRPGEPMTEVLASAEPGPGRKGRA